MLLCNSVFLAVSAAVASAVTTRSFGLRAPLPPPLDAGEIVVAHGPLDTNGSVLPPLNTTYYFDQLIDHNDPSKGTFQQRYWMTWNFYEDGACLPLCPMLTCGTDG